MATLTIRLPDAQRDRLAAMAARRGVSLNKLMQELSVRALAEHDTELRFRARAARARIARRVRPPASVGRGVLTRAGPAGELTAPRDAAAWNCPRPRRPACVKSRERFYKRATDKRRRPYRHLGYACISILFYRLYFLTETGANSGNHCRRRPCGDRSSLEDIVPEAPPPPPAFPGRRARASAPPRVRPPFPPRHRRQGVCDRRGRHPRLAPGDTVRRHRRARMGPAGEAPGRLLVRPRQAGEERPDPGNRRQARPRRGRGLRQVQARPRHGDLRRARHRRMAGPGGPRHRRLQRALQTRRTRGEERGSRDVGARPEHRPEAWRHRTPKDA